MKNKLSYEELTEKWYNSLDEIKELKKELLDLKELILKTINIFEVALELKEVKRNSSHNELIRVKMETIKK